MAKTWEGVSKAAMQILGPQGKIPPEFSSGMIKSGKRRESPGRSLKQRANLSKKRWMRMYGMPKTFKVRGRHK